MGCARSEVLILPQIVPGADVASAISPTVGATQLYAHCFDGGNDVLRPDKPIGW